MVEKDHAMREPKPHEQLPPRRRSRVLLSLIVLLILVLVGVAIYGLVDRPEQGTLTPYGADYRSAPVR